MSVSKLSNLLPVDGARLWSDLMTIANITEPDVPYTRRSFTARFLEGREWLTKRFQEAGLNVHIDAAGNLIGRRQGQTPSLGTIIIGSHSDTVPCGGRFDGVAGVIAALEIARALHDKGIVLRHNLEIVDYLAEEPSEYGLSCVGSRGISGCLAEEQLAFTDPNGERLDQAIDRIGGDVAALHKAKREDIAASFELHIEQGIVLEEGNINLGIVTAIVGIARVEVVFTGRADHAGTTPMDLRKDASLPAAQFIDYLNRSGNEFAQQGRGHFVATSGVIQIVPNAANVVPGSARLVLDIRSEDHDLTRDFLALAHQEAQLFAANSNTKLQSWKILSDTTPSYCDSNLQVFLAQSAEKLGFSQIPMASGAGHDTAFMTRLAPACMVFVPCREGRSHAPEEWAEPEAISAGAAAIYEAVLRFDLENKCHTEVDTSI